MSDPKLISPMLDNFVMGDPISDHNGVRSCPAMEKESDNRYIVKIISTPASPVQLDALLLSGAYGSKEEALTYFRSLADGILQEVDTLRKLSGLEGFIPFDDSQLVPMDDETGYDVYLLSTYRHTLQRYLRNHTMTHLEALNLGLDLCAALTVCRRSGYLYANLKPDNIYITPERGYRIGDLGFLKLDTLKYASLPDRYRSQYTAPEIADAYSSLNTTIDIYAVGLILYQVFNNGILPFTGDSAPEENFPAPAFADYEMAEIIGKACACNPDDRWQDPVEMGQALVAYMQRNGAHDTPITPVAEPEPDTEEDQPGTFEASEPAAETTEATEAAEAETAEQAVPEESTGEEITPEEITEEDIYSEDEEGNLTFLSDSDEDETVPGDDADTMEYDDVSEEVSDMLQQADEIIAHEAPEPVVQPEPIDVPIPDPIVIEAETEAPDTTEETEDSQEDTTETAGDASEEAEEIEDEEHEEEEKPGSHWVRNVLLVLLALGLLVGGFFFYKNYYLQPIDAILLEEGEDGVLTVLVNSPVSEEKLTVICSDTYGNQLQSPVVSGKAIFTGLAPNSAYTVEVAVAGFHKLTGDTSAAYTTPVQTNIVQFSAVTGGEDGSIILGFAIDGPDADQWRISYVADNGESQQTTFTGHTVTLTGFTIGNPYTFTLAPVSDQSVTGATEVTYTASKIVKATNLMITGCTNSTLTASWSAPEGVQIDSWTVRCYSESGFDKTTVVTEAAASFQIPDDTAAYTVEVTAAGMSVSERAFAAANALTVTNFQADSADPGKLAISWETDAADTQKEWVLLCSVNGSAAQEIGCNANTAEISPVIPGCTYTLTLQAADGTSLLGNLLSYTVPAPADFEGYGVARENMEFFMVRTPSYSGWDRYDLSSSDYRTEFSVDEAASFLIQMHSEYNTSDDTIVSLFVIRDENGSVIDSMTTSETWTGMWHRNYCELDIPRIPTTPGSYTVTVYFNGALAADVPFTVVE